MTEQHYDYDDKTKAERRERHTEKKRARMGQGKSVKLLYRLAMERAAALKKEDEEREQS